MLGHDVSNPFSLWLWDGMMKVKKTVELTFSCHKVAKSKYTGVNPRERKLESVSHEVVELFIINIQPTSGLHSKGHSLPSVSHLVIHIKPFQGLIKA